MDINYDVNQELGLKLGPDNLPITENKVVETTGSGILTEEAKKSIGEMRKRVERLDNKAPIIKGIPNPIIYYAATATIAYLAYKIIF